MRIIVAILLGTVLVARGAVAGAGATSPEYERCLERAGDVVTKSHDCMSLEVQRLDHVLTAEYRKLMKAAAPPLATAWRNAQHAWVPYRKAECDFASAPEQNGLGLGMWVDMSYGCEMDMTAARTRALREPVRFKPYHSPSLDACTAGAGHRCAEAEAQRLDKDLNAVYRALMAAIAKNGDDTAWRVNYRTTLRASERAWLAWRDAECTLVAVASGGERSASDNCRLTLVAERVNLFHDALEALSKPLR